MQTSASVQCTIMDEKDLVTSAKLAEHAERYEDMAEFMKEVATKHKVLSTEERNLLSVAYKNVVGPLRHSWRVLSCEEQKTECEDKKKQVQNYKEKVEKELKKICNEVLVLLDKDLIPNASDTESTVFYYKMEGDYYRYIAEVASEEEKEDTVKKSEDGYQKADELACREMEPTHPMRLGLALNFSVFYYEIQNSSDKACCLATKAYNDAILSLEKQNDESSKDSALIMHLLKDNLTLWTNESHCKDVEQAQQS